MEEAGASCGKWIAGFVHRRKIRRVCFFCGTGNNGGDGLVAARVLSAMSSDILIDVVLCQGNGARRAPEMESNLSRWRQILRHRVTTSLSVFNSAETPPIPSDALIVDAIFGIGLNRPAVGVYADVIRHINASDAPVVAIDIPSGLLADAHTPDGADVVMADHTLTIQYPKTALLLPEAYPFCGEVEVMDIGMIPPPGMEWDREILTKGTMAGLLRPLHRYAHKGSHGHGLLIAGSADMPGAAILAATAALRGGIGKVTVHTAAAAARHIPARLPEAIIHPDTDEHHISVLHWETLRRDINAIAVGPGIGTHRQTVNLLKNLLDEVRSPLILDADALNILSDNKTWLAYLPPYSILTPHFKEFERLAGPSTDDFHRLEQARAFAQKFGVVLVLKGCHTVVSLPDGKQFFNTTGNPGMATAGSGDVLTGLLLSFMAQGYNPVTSALAGVFVHGLAGDMYAKGNSPRSLIASDLPNCFAAAFREMALPPNFIPATRI